MEEQPKYLEGKKAEYEFNGEVRSVALYHNPDQGCYILELKRPLKTATALENLSSMTVVISNDKENILTSMNLSKTATKALLRVLLALYNELTASDPQSPAPGTQIDK